MVWNCRGFTMSWIVSFLILSLINSRVLDKLRRLSELQLLHPQNGEGLYQSYRVVGRFKGFTCPYMVFYPETGTEDIPNNASFSPFKSKPCMQCVTDQSESLAPYSQSVLHIRVATGDTATYWPARCINSRQISYQQTHVCMLSCKKDMSLINQHFYLKGVESFPKHGKTPITFVSGWKGISLGPTVAKGQTPAAVFLKLVFLFSQASQMVSRQLISSNCHVPGARRGMEMRPRLGVLSTHGQVYSRQRKIVCRARLIMLELMMSPALNLTEQLSDVYDLSLHGKHLGRGWLSRVHHPQGDKPIMKLAERGPHLHSAQWRTAYSLHVMHACVLSHFQSCPTLYTIL